MPKGAQHPRQCPKRRIYRYTHIRDRKKEQIAAWKEKVSSSIPLRRLGRSEEVAKAVLFLASQDRGYLAGVELFMDGGMGQI
jgi:NAD(P)-dependent dehydrogenase (short-subunit alcohol dehydrogenase family)